MTYERAMRRVLYYAAMNVATDADAEADWLVTDSDGCILDAEDTAMMQRAAKDFYEKHGAAGEP